MRYACCLVLGFTLGSSTLWAQAPFLDFGAEPDIQERQEIQQWWVEKELRNGHNPYTARPCE